MNKLLVRHILYGVFFVLLELLVFQHLTLFGASVDPLLFYLLWIIQKYDRTTVLFFAAGLSLFQDALFDFWGINMFCKILMVFITYNYVNSRSEAQLLLWQIFLIILAAALMHNIALFALLNFFSSYVSSFAPFTIIVWNSVYTAIIGLLIYIFRVR